MDEKKYNILIVDDEIMVIRSIIRVLENEQYNFYYTVDSTKMAEIVENTSIDVIISDQRMPEMTGIELLKQAKEICPSAVRILMSGYSDIDIVIAAINEGKIYQYITKPWDNDKMIETVKGAIKLKTEEEEKAAIIAYSLKDIENWKSMIDRMNSELEKRSDSTINALVKVIKAKDYNLYKHSYCVAETASYLAKEMSLETEQIESVRAAGLFHDIGKIAIRDKVMYKPGSLDDDEYMEMKNHPTVGAEILREVDFLGKIADIVEQHHERIDGNGYPNRLTQENTLLESQIVSLADTYEALREDRVYRGGMSPTKALETIFAERLKFNYTAIQKLAEAVHSERANFINTKYVFN